MPYEALLIAVENIIIDRVATHSVSKAKKIDTGAPMEIGMAAGTDGEEAFEEGHGKAPELAVQAVYKGTGGRGGWNGGKDPNWSVQKYFNSGKGEKKGANRAGTGQWSKTGGKKRRKRVREGGTSVCWSCGKTGRIAANCTKESWNRSLNAVEEDKADISGCMRGVCCKESENEQWQEVTSKK